MALPLMFAAVLVVVAITSLILPATFNSALWLTVGFLLSIVGPQIKETITSLDIYLTRHRPFSRITTNLQTAIPLRNYVDLVAVTFTVLMLTSVIFDAFQFALTSLVSNGFVAFPRGDDGFVHLQTYVSGFLVLPALIVALSAYGIRRGFVRRETSFGGLFGAVLVAALFSMLLLSVIRHEFTLIKNYRLLQHANPGALPVSVPLAVVTALAFVLFIFFVATFYIWVCVQTGRLMRLGYNKIIGTKSITHSANEPESHALGTSSGG